MQVALVAHHDGRLAAAGDDPRRDQAPLAARRQRAFPAVAYRLAAELGRRADRVFEDDLVGEKLPTTSADRGRSSTRSGARPRAAPAMPSATSRRRARFAQRSRTRDRARCARYGPERRVGTRAVDRQRPQPHHARAEPGEADRATGRRRSVGQRPDAERRIRAAEAGADFGAPPRASSGAAPARPRRRPGSALPPVRTRTAQPRSPVPIARASSYAARQRALAAGPGDLAPEEEFIIFEISGVDHEWLG